MPSRQVVAEPDQQVGGRLGVGPARCAWASSMPKKFDSVGELVVLEVRIALAGDRQGVEVAALLEVRAVAERGLEEAEVEPDGVADDRRVADELEGLLGGLGRASGPS